MISPKRSSPSSARALALLSANIMLAAHSVRALPNGLGKLPGLGWNSDYCTNCTGPASAVPLSARNGGGLASFRSQSRGFGGEHFIKHIADHMHAVKYPTTTVPQTLQELGFRYVNMDASWDSYNRSSTGSLVPDPKLWPSGMAKTVSYIHSLEMGFGLYGDRGTLDCARHPGAEGHEKADGTFMGTNKIDWYKEDACYASGDQASALAAYGKMRDALNSTGYKTWFALCGWENWYAAHGQGLANSARIGPDTGTGWSAVLKNVENALPVQQYIGGNGAGGYWNDGSLMLTPGMGCPGHHGAANSANCMSNDRFQSMFSLWTILSFNILLVGDFAKLNPFVMKTYTNDVAISINQDPLGHGAVRIDGGTEGPGALLSTDEELELWRASYSAVKVQECGGEPKQQKWVFDKPAKGQVSNDNGEICLNVEGCETKLIYDGCEKPTKPCGTPTPANPFPNEDFTMESNGNLVSGIKGLCATVGAAKTVTLETCAKPVAANQKWKYDNATQELTTGDGLCVTAGSGPGPSPIKPEGMILGRPLASKSPSSGAAKRGFAVLFLNNKNVSTMMTCEKACMTKLMAPSAHTLQPGDSFVVDDVITHEKWSTAFKVGDSLATKQPVAANGGSVYLRLTYNN